MKSVLIDWKSITPSEDTKNQTEKILNSLKFLLPPDSDIRVNVEKHNKNYTGHLVVRSPMGDFAAHAENKNLFNLCKALRKNLKLQIFRHREARPQWSRAS